MLCTSIYSVLDSLYENSRNQYKQEGLRVAKACVRIALSKYIQNNGYQGNENIKIGENDCQIDSVNKGASTSKFNVQVSIENIVSHDDISFSSETMKITHEEIF